MITLFGPVGPEILVIVAVLILLFGASRIPRLANSVGKSLGSFKKGRQEIEQEIQEMEKETTETVNEAKSGVNEISSDVESEAQEAKDAVTPDAELNTAEEQ